MSTPGVLVEKHGSASVNESTATIREIMESAAENFQMSPERSEPDIDFTLTT